MNTDSKNLYNRRVLAEPGDPMGIAAFLCHFLPKNALSCLTGWVARLRLPTPFATWLVKGFARAFAIDLIEAEFPVEHYASIEDLFTRRLRDGARPVVGPVCSPADGYLARSAKASHEEAVQAKGLSYSLADLIYGESAEPHAPLDLSWYATVYLAPHNYHRVHAPFAGKLTALRYLPGELWPVNVPFISRIPRLFNRNERLVFDFDLDGGGRAYVVMVGALNVGRMVTPFQPDLVTNSFDRQLGARPSSHRFIEPPTVAVAQELGTFMLGSTVIIAFDSVAANRYQFVQTDQNKPILMGQSLLVQIT